MPLLQGEHDPLVDGAAFRLAVGLGGQLGPHGGTYAEQIVASEQSVVRAPKNASDAEAPPC